MPASKKQIRRFGELYPNFPRPMPGDNTITVIAPSNSSTPGNPSVIDMTNQASGNSIASMINSNNTGHGDLSGAGGNGHMHNAASSAVLNNHQANHHRFAGHGSSAPNQVNMNYEDANLDEITIRQLNEDIIAYRYDLDFCKGQLLDLGLSPQETRTLQLRTLDLGHQIRHCQHRIETLQVQMRSASNNQSQSSYMPNRVGSGVSNATGYPSSSHAHGNSPAFTPKRPAGSAGGGKRTSLPASDSSAPPPHKRAKTEMEMLADDDEVLGEDGHTTLQRLGMWKCRLCTSSKFLLAGDGRSPAMPCKWPLKDVSKMITHFTEMHTEHTTIERCVELGGALDKNRGPFEYWLRRTRAQKLGEDTIDDCINALLAGNMPSLLRRLSRAAAGMPTL